MAKKYTYSRMIHTPEGQESFTAVEFDAFDEAQKVVEKAIHDRNLELDKKYPKGTNSGLGRADMGMGFPGTSRTLVGPGPAVPAPGSAVGGNIPPAGNSPGAHGGGGGQ